jgi:predicted dehydrogenase
MGKHLFVEKPLTHNVYESRLLTKLAAKHKIATSMGNQGASGPGVRQIIDWIQDGQIGEIRRVDAFTDRPVWPQGLSRPTRVDRVPRTMDWNLFVGPAPMRPFAADVYTPWNFRGWWDFGTGALGDMACHVLHPVFMALNLGFPSKVEGTSTLLLTESAPKAQKVKYTFPARKNLPRVAFPEVEVNWYDGGLQPFRPEGIPVSHNLNDAGGGVIFYGTKDTLICGSFGVRPWLLSGRTPSSPKTQREVPNNNHYQDFVRAAKESAANRVETASPFCEAGPFNEMIVMGVLAVRLQSLHQELHWDGQNMKFTNIPDDATIRTIINDNFSITDGHPSFDRDWTERVNANEFAKNLINAPYHNGYKLPPMPV